MEGKMDIWYEIELLLRKIGNYDYKEAVQAGLTAGDLENYFKDSVDGPERFLKALLKILKRNTF